MSQGAFVRSRYESDAGTVHPIRVQPETIAMTLGGTANGVPAGAVNSGISARVSGGRRQLGLTARKVTIAFVAGDVPEGYLEGSTISLPWLNPATFGALGAGATGIYQGSAVELVGKSAESIR